MPCTQVLTHTHFMHILQPKRIHITCYTRN